MESTECTAQTWGSYPEIQNIEYKYTGRDGKYRVYCANLSPKFKRVSLNETPEFPSWGLNICVDFDLRDSKKMENMKKLNIIIFQNKNNEIHKTALPLS